MYENTWIRSATWSPSRRVWSSGTTLGGVVSLSDWFVTSVPATPRKVRKLVGLKFALRLPVKRSMLCPVKI